MVPYWFKQGYPKQRARNYRVQSVSMAYRYMGTVPMWPNHTRSTKFRNEERTEKKQQS